MRLDIAITYVISAAVKTADCLPMRDGNMLMPPRPHRHGGHSSLPAPPGVTASGLFQRPDYCRACTLWAAEKKGPFGTGNTNPYTTLFLPAAWNLLPVLSGGSIKTHCSYSVHDWLTSRDRHGFIAESRPRPHAGRTAGPAAGRVNDNNSIAEQESTTRGPVSMFR